MVQRLQSVANKFVWLIFKLDLRESVKDSMQQLGNLTVNQLAELETANFMYRYKYLHNKLPTVFNGLLDKNTIGEKTHNTRSQSKVFPLFRRIELTKQSMKHRGPRTWNAIPISDRESKSLKSFNKLTKAHLMSLK